VERTPYGYVITGYDEIVALHNRVLVAMQKGIDLGAGHMPEAVSSRAFISFYNDICAFTRALVAVATAHPTHEWMSNVRYIAQLSDIPALNAAEEAVR
jgi:hypothetical protein